MAEARNVAPGQEVGSARRVLLGVITPSSNTVLEPVTQAILASLGPNFSAHFQRFSVTRIGADATALHQFDTAPMLAAARMLTDARVEVIVWSGTSGSWLGVERDHELVRDISAATGVKATTAVLALDEAMAALGARRLGLVTPYVSEIQRLISAQYAARGIEVVAERHFEDPGNFSFSEHGEAEIADAIQAVAAARPDVIAILCTNLRGASVAAALEAGIGIPILDSVSVSVWKSLGMAGVPPGRVRGWGRLFDLATAPANESVTP